MNTEETESLKFVLVSTSADRQLGKRLTGYPKLALNENVSIIAVCLCVLPCDALCVCDVSMMSSAVTGRKLFSSGLILLKVFNLILNRVRECEWMHADRDRYQF